MQSIAGMDEEVAMTGILLGLIKALVEECIHVSH